MTPRSFPNLTLSPLLRCATLLAALALPHVAIADVIDPAEEACSGKSEGTACSASGVSGTCQPGQCCKLDYSNGTPPTSKCSPCQVCKSAAAPEDVAGDSNTASDISDSDTNGKGTSVSTTDDSGGCSVGGGMLPPWTVPGLLVGASALVWLRRRGRQA